MGSFIIEGGHKLKGEITPQGAKNEALQILCATLLSKEKIIINNLPDIIDINILIELLKDLGVEVKKIKSNTYSFKAENIDLDYLTSSEFKIKGTRIRGSIMILGPLLSRFGKGYIPKPGGDKIGRRRLDTHFLSFEKLGANFEFDEKESFYKVSTKGLKGNYILLDEASVTGTANVVMTAVMAKGTTTIYNAACEPYLQQLCKMLNSMGAKISGVGSNLLTIEGVEYLNGCEHTILPDMIEIGSFIGLAAMTQSELLIKNVSWENLGIIPSVFQKLGIKIERQNDNMFIPFQESYEIQNFIDGSILTISDSPWPGFTPDLLSIILVVATQAKGSVLIHQKMFESRLFFTDKLIDMGAQIILCDPHRASVIGLNRKTSLRGTKMSSPDIRAGVSLLIAALSAEGKSTIDNIHQIDRGYEKIDERLQSIGAKIKRIK
ncbi:MAG: UDP-N-acetylglucosamine 1-carboxyvinyltransferase [Flavobacteriales bacterium]|nr:UDP-N-acetylglucosamine 1-carboxyvinyltransferase [Flavobacteriales bacterium]